MRTKKKKSYNSSFNLNIKYLNNLKCCILISVSLSLLKDGYGDYALFFHDTYGGTVIGVLLKPTVLEHKDFKVSDANCRKLNTDGKLVLNISTMIEDFYILGRGIIRTIDIPNKRFSLTSESTT